MGNFGKNADNCRHNAIFFSQRSNIISMASMKIFLLVKLALCWEFLGTAEAGVDGLVVVVSLQVHQHCLVFSQPCLGKITQQLAIFHCNSVRARVAYLDLVRYFLVNHDHCSTLKGTVSRDG
jgi:hypothetical protein